MWQKMTTKMIDVIGGETRLIKLVDEFYDLIETIPEGQNIKKLHLRGHGLGHVRIEQFNFLSGFLGGRRYFEEKHGHMNVKLMHAHVPISRKDAEDWLSVMDMALEKNGLRGAQIDKLRKSFRNVALLLVNEDE